MSLTHEPDPDTPLEETLRALDDLVAREKVARDRRSNSKLAARAGARDQRAAPPRAIRLGPELVRLLAARTGRVFRAVRARPSRLHAVQPARRRLARRPVSPRPAVSGRLQDDAAPRAVLRPRAGGPVRRARAGLRTSRRGARHRRRRRSPRRGCVIPPEVTAVVVGPRRPGAPRAGARGRRAAAPSPEERDELAGLFARSRSTRSGRRSERLAVSSSPANAARRARPRFTLSWRTSSLIGSFKLRGNAERDRTPLRREQLEEGVHDGERGKHGPGRRLGCARAGRRLHRRLAGTMRLRQ